VTLRVAPETLSVLVPSLVIQPIVENAIHHGLESTETGGNLDIKIEDFDAEVRISVEDDGVGADPARLRRILAGSSDDDAVGLRNVDERLRTVYGEEYGLTIETGRGAGTKVLIRVPKYHAQLQAS
jgi:two-component system LytT family sensor kinase